MKSPGTTPKQEKSKQTSSSHIAAIAASKIVEIAPRPSGSSTEIRPLPGSRWGFDEPASLSTARTAPSARTRAPGRWTRFELDAPAAQNVFLAGSFNNWNPSATPMMRLHDGKWARELWLPLGKYEYLFVVDGQWTPHPESADRLPNPFGGCNSVMRVD